MPKWHLYQPGNNFISMLIIFFEIPGGHLENGGHIGFFKVAPRLNLKVRLQAIMPKMVLCSNVVNLTNFCP